MEGAANIIASNTRRYTKDYDPADGGTVANDYDTLIAFTNGGVGAVVGYVWQFDAADGQTGVTQHTVIADYLGDGSITQARALKSTLIIENVTTRLKVKPGLFALTTNQRFTSSGSAPTALELRAIRSKIMSHPKTNYHPGTITPEICNVALTAQDYPYYRSSSDMKRTIFDYDGVEVRRPMTVTWVYIPHTSKITDTDDTNQHYALNFYTSNRTRHNISTVLATTVKPPGQHGPMSSQGETEKHAQEGVE